MKEVTWERGSKIRRKYPNFKDEIYIRWRGCKPLGNILDNNKIQDDEK